MPFGYLPPELLIRILAYIAIQDIVSFELVSRSCREVIRANESPIYLAAAAFHGFIQPLGWDEAPPLLSVVAGVPDATGSLDSVTSWKEFCKLPNTWLYDSCSSQPV